jgi:hypothetical protein
MITIPRRPVGLNQSLPPHLAARQMRMGPNLPQLPPAMPAPDPEPDQEPAVDTEPEAESDPEAQPATVVATDVWGRPVHGDAVEIEQQGMEGERTRITLRVDRAALDVSDRVAAAVRSVAADVVKRLARDSDVQRAVRLEAQHRFAARRRRAAQLRRQTLEASKEELEFNADVPANLGQKLIAIDAEITQARDAEAAAGAEADRLLTLTQEAVGRMHDLVRGLAGRADLRRDVAASVGDAEDALVRALLDRCKPELDAYAVSVALADALPTPGEETAHAVMVGGVVADLCRAAQQHDASHAAGQDEQHASDTDASDAAAQDLADEPETATADAAAG